MLLTRTALSLSLIFERPFSVLWAVTFCLRECKRATLKYDQVRRICDS
jgi:hypothetical protein